MSLKFINSQEFLNKLQTHINALIAIPMLALIYFFLRIENNSYNPEFLSDEVLYFLRLAILLLILALVITGLTTFRKIIRSRNIEMALRDKLELFFSASIKRSYMFGVATILSLAGLVLSAEQLYVAYYTICLVAFSITYPTMHRIIHQLQLKKEERDIILTRKRIQ